MTGPRVRRVIVVGFGKIRRQVGGCVLVQFCRCQQAVSYCCLDSGTCFYVECGGSECNKRKEKEIIYRVDSGSHIRCNNQSFSKKQYSEVGNSFARVTAQWLGFLLDTLYDLGIFLCKKGYFPLIYCHTIFWAWPCLSSSSASCVILPGI